MRVSAYRDDTNISSAGFIPPTWAQIDLRLCDTVELQDGRVVRLQTYFDTATMLRQMGLFPNSPLHTTDRRAPLELYATEVDNRVVIAGREAARKTLRVDLLLAIAPEASTVAIPGEETTDPAFGMPARPRSRPTVGR